MHSGHFHLCLEPHHDFLCRLYLAAPTINDHLPAREFLHAWEHLLGVEGLHLIVLEVLVRLSARHDFIDGRAEGKKVGSDGWWLLEWPWEKKPGALNRRAHNSVEGRAREVDDLEPGVGIQQEVFGLEIAVNDPVGMEEMQAFGSIIGPLQPLSKGYDGGVGGGILAEMLS